MHQIEEKFGNSVVERGSKSKNKSWKNIEEIAKKKKKYNYLVVEKYRKALVVISLDDQSSYLLQTDFLVDAKTRIVGSFRE